MYIYIYIFFLGSTHGSCSWFTDVYAPSHIGKPAPKRLGGICSGSDHGFGFFHLSTRWPRWPWPQKKLKDFWTKHPTFRLTVWIRCLWWVCVCVHIIYVYVYIYIYIALLGIYLTIIFHNRTIFGGKTSLNHRRMLTKKNTSPKKIDQ